MNLNSREQHALDHAAYFTAIRGRSPRDRIRRQFDSIEAARAFAAEFGDGRTMIYAVTSAGRDAHICNA